MTRPRFDGHFYAVPLMDMRNLGCFSGFVAERSPHLPNDDLAPQNGDSLQNCRKRSPRGDFWTTGSLGFYRDFRQPVYRYYDITHHMCIHCISNVNVMRNIDRTQHS